MDIETPRPPNLAAPLWVIAVAMCVLAAASVVGSMKVYQAQESLRQEIEKIPKIPKIRL